MGNYIKRCYQLGAYTQLVSELQLEDAQQFRNFTRISAVEVQSLVNILSPVIGKQDAAMKQALPMWRKGNSNTSLSRNRQITSWIFICESCNSYWSH
jgi:hypothetical protein